MTVNRKYNLRNFRAAAIVAIAVLVLYNIFISTNLSSHFDLNIESNIITMKLVDAIILLNETDAQSLNNNKNYNNRKSPTNTNGNGFKIDILTIGSKFNINDAKAQMETFGSHPVRRYFFLATEEDDPDPLCYENIKNTTRVADHHKKCYPKSRRNEVLKALGAARTEWLLKKKNPGGWICAQRRFTSGLGKLANLYKTQHDNNHDINNKNDILPDYLIMTDADTYVNLEHITEAMLRQPNQRESKGLLHQDDLSSFIPTHHTPVVFAGCRVRLPVHQANFTFPFGGFGTFFSKGALERLIHPLYCNDSTSHNGNHNHNWTTNNNNNNHNNAKKSLEQYETNACQMLTTPGKALLDEHQFYEPGRNLAEIMWALAKDEAASGCLHSDWMVGYMINYYHLSRHVVHNKKNYHTSAGWHDAHQTSNVISRLHAFMSSEIYKKNEGNCEHGGDSSSKSCPFNATICHRLNAAELTKMHLAQ